MNDFTYAKQVLEAQIYRITNYKIVVPDSKFADDKIKELQQAISILEKESKDE